MGSPAEQQALRFAADRFKEYGCDTAYIMPFSRTRRGNTNSGIAVGVKRGVTGRVIVIGGHIDSAGPEIPGATDNGSGSAVVMELARVLCQRQMQSTLVFACFGGEEQGLLGSEFFVNNFPEIDSVVLMLNIDMANGLGIIEIDGTTPGLSAPAWLVRAAFEEFSRLGYTGQRYPTHAFTFNNAAGGQIGTDHHSFLQVRIPAISFTTDPNHPIHTAQDHFGDFDFRGLKRSGDVVLGLVERFDGGVPARELETYWLYVFLGNPIFVPHWLIRVFLAVSIVGAVVVVLLLRRRHAELADPIGWSGWKLYLFTVIIVSFAWISSDVVGLLKGYRYPWFTDIELYVVLAALFALVGVWLSVMWSRKLRLSLSAYVFFKRAAIWLIVFTGLFALGHIEAALYPAVALFLLSLAMVVRNRVVMFAAWGLGAVWMMRLIYSEWHEFLFRSVARIGTLLVSLPLAVVYDLVMIMFLAVFVYPLALGFVSVYRQARHSPALRDVGGQAGSPGALTNVFRSRSFPVLIGIFIAAMVAYLYPREVYSEKWYRNVEVEQKIDLSSDPSRGDFPAPLLLKSAEFLDGIRVSFSTRDTIITGRISRASIPVPESEAAEENIPEWLRVERTHTQVITGDTVLHQATVTLLCARRPYRVTVIYSSDEGVNQFSSPWMFTTVRRNRMLVWNSFPDSVLTIPVAFQTTAGDSVRESIEVVFDELPLSVELEREKTNFIRRATYSASAIYKNDQGEMLAEGLTLHYHKFHQ